MDGIDPLMHQFIVRITGGGRGCGMGAGENTHGLPLQAAMLEAQVIWVLEQGLIVCAAVKHDREHLPVDSMP